tara:strand:- start:2430 stop:2765 length:336 start_codon:yes stop_codon:yes gene_type:complete
MVVAKKIQKLLNNEVVFAVAVILAFLNVAGYIFVRSYECLAVFVAVACVSNYFSKNYVVDILAALFVANIVFGCGRIHQEGFAEGNDAEEDPEKVEQFTEGNKDEKEEVEM